MKTKFSIKPNEKASQFLQWCGIPAGLITNFDLDLKSYLSAFDISSKTPRVITVQQQIKYVDNVISSKKPYLAVIHSDQFYLQARQLALVIFWYHLQSAINADKGRPLWSIITAGFSNSILEEYQQGNISIPNLLVLDALYADMPVQKIDKVQDIIQTLCDRPRILIFRGCPPHNYCVEKFGIRPSCIIQLGRSPDAKKTIKI